MYLYLNDNETDTFDDDYVKVFFTKSEKMFESKAHHRTIMALLINEKVFDTEWHLIDENVDIFITKYDENISNRTIRN